MHSKLIKFHKEATPEILELLDSLEYGTNGAIYRHIDTRERVAGVDNPLYVTLERDSKVIANLTFCCREQGWYIRFFGFSQKFRASDKTRRATSNSKLRKELKQLFDDLLDEGRNGFSAPLLYAYIDPQNERSRLISSDFGFKPMSRLITQTFSRIFPKSSVRFCQINDHSEIKEQLIGSYSSYRFFQDQTIRKGQFFGIRDRRGELIAFSRAMEVNWTIIQLPGKFGKPLASIIPYIPFINRLLRPKKHTFLAADAVWLLHNDPALLEELFSSLLAEKKLNLLIWWTDERDPVSKPIRKKVRWGLLDKIVGRTPVDVMIKSRYGTLLSDNNPVFVSAYDMI